MILFSVCYLLNKLTEQIDLVSDCLQRAAPEGLVGQVDIGHLCHFLGSCHGCGVQQLIVLGNECLTLLLVLGVQASCEQAAESVGETIVGGAIVVTLADPHIGVQRAFIQTVAVGCLLGIGHEFAQGVRMHEFLGAVLEHALFKAEAGVDIADDLGGILQLRFDQRQLFLVVCSLGDGRCHDHALIEGGCSLCQRHGVVVVQGLVILDALVVPSVAQLMSQSHHIAEGTVVVGQNS